MTDDFAVLDFILVVAPVDRVAIALAQSFRTTAKPAEIKPKGGLMSRFLGKSSPTKGARALTVHPVNTVAATPLARLNFDPTKDSEPVTMRLSGPVDSSGMTLIEFVEPEVGQSSVALALSTELPGSELFYFRYSGTRHPGADYAFHVYQDGRAVRRAASISFSGTSPESQWTATDKGMPHPMETDSLPASETPQGEIMTPERQASILMALGIEPDTLFTDQANRETVAVLSTNSGGEPVSSLVAPKAPKAPKSVVPPAPAIAADAEAPLQLLDAEPPSEAGTAPAPEAPQVETIDWETSVTTLLLEAVEAGLPEDEQVPWLDTLTQQLNDGNVEQALESAISLIDKGDRPKKVRIEAAEKLRSLYAHLIDP